MIVGDLRKDPHALGTAWVSVTIFASVARMIIPLREIASLYPPRLLVDDGTNPEATLRELTVQVDTRVRKTTHETEGNWRPVVYLLTDGRPTNDTTAEVERQEDHYAGKVNPTAAGLEPSADLNILRQLAENAMLFTESQEGDSTRFIKWITASVTTHSRNVGGDKQPEFNQIEYVIRLAKDEPTKAYDENCITSTGRCNKTRRPYLMKYKRPPARVSGLDFSLDPNSFNITRYYPINEDYFAWSDATATDLQVNTNELHDVPGCPHYGNASAFALCSCRELLCIDGSDDVICLWCETGLSFSNDGGNTSFGVDRGRD